MANDDAKKTRSSIIQTLAKVYILKCAIHLAISFLKWFMHGRAVGFYRIKYFHVDCILFARQ